MSYPPKPDFGDLTIIKFKCPMKNVHYTKSESESIRRNDLITNSLLVEFFKELSVMGKLVLDRFQIIVIGNKLN